MVNRQRGEVEAVLDGQRYTLCLTLGALAELEDSLAVGDINGLVERFGRGRLSSGDMIALIGAGLRGGGQAIDDVTVSGMRCEAGLAGFAHLAGELLTATFGTGVPAPNS